MGFLDRIVLWSKSMQPSKIDMIITEYEGRESLKEAAKNVLLASAMLSIGVILISSIGLGVLRLIWSIIVPYLNETIAQIEAQNYLSLQFQVAGTILGFSYAVIALVMFPFAFFIMQAVQFLLAKAFGGKAPFSKQAYYCGMVFAAAEIASISIAIPCMGLIMTAFAGIAGIYANYLFIKKLHSLGTLSAILVIFISAIIGLLLYVFFWQATFSLLLIIINPVVSYVGKYIQAS